MSDISAPWASIIIVNYNGAQVIERTLRALRRQTEQDFELLIVDNASSDESLERISASAPPQARLLALDENTGFAGGNNYAARQARGEWLALLNPDTEAAADWLAAFRRAAEQHPRIDMFAGATLSLESPEVMDGAGDCYFAFGQPWRGGFGRPADEMPTVGTCFSACGAVTLIRRSVFLELGGFDERFFCYCEDVDLGFRLRLRGGTCLFWPDAVAGHVGGGVAGQRSDFALRHGARNRLWTFVKNMPPLAFWSLLPGHALLTLVLLGRAALRGEAGPILEGLKEARAGLREVWRDRQAVQASRTISSWQLLSSFSWNPVSMLKRKPDVRPLGRSD